MQVAEGGRPGLGNSVLGTSIQNSMLHNSALTQDVHFLYTTSAGTSTRRARSMPSSNLPGERGQQRSLLLELKLIADIGLVGYPNVRNIITHYYVDYLSCYSL